MLCLCLLRPVCIIMRRGWSFGLVCKAPTDLSISIYILMLCDATLSEPCEYVPYGADGSRLQHDKQGSLMELWQHFLTLAWQRSHNRLLLWTLLWDSQNIMNHPTCAMWTMGSYDFQCVKRQTRKQCRALAYFARLHFADKHCFCCASALWLWRWIWLSYCS